MKPILFLLALSFAACAPKAILVEEAPNKPAASGRAENTAATEPAADLPAAGDELGLLDPKDLTRLPSTQDMRPTVETAATKPVIAAPPSDKPAVSAE